jgi:hypothetical protein
VKDSTVPAASIYTSPTSGQSGTANLDTTAGVALNGVLIHASSNVMSVDPYYPKAWSGVTSISADLFDACLGHPEYSSGIYHYHMLPPCLVNKANIKTNLSCASITACADDLAKYALDAYVTAGTVD